MLAIKAMSHLNRNNKLKDVHKRINQDNNLSPLHEPACVVDGDVNSLLPALGSSAAFIVDLSVLSRGSRVIIAKCLISLVKRE